MMPLRRFPFRWISLDGDSSGRIWRGRLAAGALFAAILAINLLRARGHALWRDEGQAWMLAHASTSLGDLFAKLGYERQPPLWHLALYALDRVWPRLFAMQAFGAVISSAATVLLVSLPWWSWPQRLLLAFNYYVVFEFALIARCYVLAFFLLALLAFVAARDRPYSAWLEFTLLGLLALTSVHGTMASLCLAAERLLNRGRAAWRGPVWLYAAMLAVVLWSLRHPPDWQFGPDPFFGWDASRLRGALLTLGMALAPVPVPRIEFWNTYWVREFPLAVRYLAVLALLGCAVWALRHSRRAVVLFLGGIVGIAAFMYVIYFGSTRHHGTAFMVLLGLLLLAPPLRTRLRANWAATALLAAGALGGAIALSQELQHPFSRSRDVARWIEQVAKPGPAVPIIGHRDTQASAVAAYLGREIYYPARGESGTYIQWDTRRGHSTPAQAVAAALDLLRRHGEAILVLDCVSAEHVNPRQLPLVQYAIFPGGIVADECYVVVQMVLPRQEAPGRR